MAGARPTLLRLCDGRKPIVIDLLEGAAYQDVNRTRPASVHKDMHTGRVFYLRAGAWSRLGA